MQTAGTVLDVIRKRGERGLPIERLYRKLFNPQLYLMAYGRIYANKGAMTPGVTKETADGMSLEKIGSIVDALRAERYRWSPARRVCVGSPVVRFPRAARPSPVARRRKVGDGYHTRKAEAVPRPLVDPDLSPPDERTLSGHRPCPDPRELEEGDDPPPVAQ